MQLISSNPTVFRNSFNVLSLTLDYKEDNVKALTTFLSLQTTTAPSHVSTVPQHSKNKCQKCKMFHSKPKTYATLTKKPSTTAEPRSCCSSIEKHHGHCKQHGFHFLPQGKLWQKLPIIKSLLQPHDLMQFWQIALVYHPTPHMVFMYIYAMVPTL